MPGSGSVLAKAALLGAAFLFLLAACATAGSFGGSRAKAVAWAKVRGFGDQELQAGPFRLLSLSRMGPAATLTIYIEGDGAAWATPYHPPRDPTPLKPVALMLAAADPSPAVAYLGRPCQYLDEGGLGACDSGYWIGRRFAPEVAAAYDEALNRLKAQAGAKRLRLVGYSGGGVIAALLAGRRDDVAAWATVASPLAVGEWTRWHGISPLAGSLDPELLPAAPPPGMHFVGEDDKTVPAAVVGRFVAAKGGRLVTVPGFDHECCWPRDWPALLQRAFAVENDE